MLLNMIHPSFAMFSCTDDKIDEPCSSCLNGVDPSILVLTAWLCLHCLLLWYGITHTLMIVFLILFISSFWCTAHWTYLYMGKCTPHILIICIIIKLWENCWWERNLLTSAAETRTWSLFFLLPKREENTAETGTISMNHASKDHARTSQEDKKRSQQRSIASFQHSPWFLKCLWTISGKCLFYTSVPRYNKQYLFLLIKGKIKVTNY